MSTSKIVRHPATWLAAILVVGGAAFQIGRANPGGSVFSPSTPVFARQASFLPNAATSPDARNESSFASLQAMNDQFADLVEQISPSVVHIRPVGQDATIRMNPGSGGSGSGVIIRPDGWIVTNAHVVGDAKEVQVILANGREYRGKVTSSDDTRNDIAVVKIDGRNLPTASFADSSQVRVGQYAIAIGAPFELENTVTFGHVSALGRANLAGGGMSSDVRSYVNMIQTDAPINPGNSGGPLLNIDGEIIGINTSIYSAGVMGGQNAGIGFSIPANQAKFISDLLINDGKLTRSFLNVSMETLKPFELEEKRIPGGVRVAAVAPGGAAAKAGLKDGDILTKVGSFSIREDQDLLNAMLRYRPNQRVDVQFMRDGKVQTVAVRPDANVLGQNAPQQRAPRSQQPQSPRFQAPDFFRDFGFDLNPREDQPQNQERAPRQEREVGQPARLGVTFESLNEELRGRFGIPNVQDGVVITDVEPGSVAAELGLQPGDVVERLGSRSIRSGNDLVEAVRAAKVGESSSITYRRFTANGMSTFTRTFEF